MHILSTFFLVFSFELQIKALKTATFDERIKELKVPEEAKKIIEREKSKLLSGEEIDGAKNYLEWLGKTTDDNTNIQKMRTIMDADLFGLKMEKKKILEFIECEEHKNDKILYLIGPDGVGKTALANSMAQALGRKFCSFSIGMLKNDAAIKGQSREVCGAMPGKLIQCLKEAQTENPLILIDDIEELNDDLTYALIDLLDSNQNAKFVDRYVGVPVNLSKVFFICSIVNYDILPGALKYRNGPMKDRPVEIEFSGYIHKIEAKRFIQPLIVNQEKLLEYFGAKIYQPLRKFADSNMPKGMAMALAGNYYSGGCIINVECKQFWPFDRTQPQLKVTGDHTEDMRRSIDIAYTVAQQVMKRKDPANKFFEQSHIHIDVDVADGPSAGAAIVSALLSLALNHPIRGILMTGEITLNEQILKIGYLKLKLDAAKIVGCNLVILPEENREEFEQLDDLIKEGINVEFVSNYDQIFELIFSKFVAAIAKKDAAVQTLEGVEIVGGGTI